MWPQNELTERLGVRRPIFQAPMGELSTPALAASVSNAGGLGGLGMWECSVDDARRRILGFRQLSAGSLNVNYPIWAGSADVTNLNSAMRRRLQTLYDSMDMGPIPAPETSDSLVDSDHLELLLEMKPEVVSFHFGLPRQEVVQALKSAGIFLISSATTVCEAKALEVAGIDCVIAQGTEAGGGRGTFLGAEVSSQPGLFALLPQIVDAVSVPVVAAGGVADGRAIAATFMLGASGVQLGTAFLRCPEANVSEPHREALDSANETSTVVTDVVSGRPFRFIKNKLVEDLSDSAAEPLPFPAQWSLTFPLEASNDPNVMGLAAGQSVALTREMPAAELVETLATETTERLRAFAE